MGFFCKLLVGRTHGGYKALDLVGVLDAPDGSAIGAVKLNTGADINRQRLATRAHLQDAIGHVCRRESTT